MRKRSNYLLQNVSRHLQIVKVFIRHVLIVASNCGIQLCEWRSGWLRLRHRYRCDPHSTRDGGKN